MKIDILGSGSAFSLTRNTSAILISDLQQKRWLIDCGPTIPRALWQRSLDINAIEVLYFTHIHPDHSTGLPALLNHWKSFDRQAPLTIYCQAEHRAHLEQLVALASFSGRPLSFEINWCNTAEEWNWRDWHIQTAESQHNMRNLGLRIEADGHSIFYSGDGRPTPATEALMKNTDLALQECAVSSPLPDDAAHGDIHNCLKLADKLQLPALGLYHCFDEEIATIEAHIAGRNGLFLLQDGQQIDLSNQSSHKARQNREMGHYDALLTGSYPSKNDSHHGLC